jgi:hypothetical protein
MMPPLILLEDLLLVFALFVVSLEDSNPAEKSKKADGVNCPSDENRLKSLAPLKLFGLTLIMVLIGPEYENWE